jgi:hypothetical protein
MAWGKQLKVLLLVVPVLAVSVSDNVFACWEENGNPISVATDAQRLPQIISDGSGGAIMAWLDYRNGNWDIYAQRVNALGVAQWTAGGIPVCTAENDQDHFNMVSDGLGGAIMVWDDLRSFPDSKVYAQRVNTFGEPQWGADGMLITPSKRGFWPLLVSDGSGGAVIAWWEEWFYGVGSTLCAMRISASGAPGWDYEWHYNWAFGYEPRITSDGSGGAIILWHQILTGGSNEVHAQRLDDSGNQRWGEGGVTIDTYLATPLCNPWIISDGSGGAIVAYHTYKYGNSGEIRAQRLDTDGAPLWTAGGVVIDTRDGDAAPWMAPCGSGGAIISWASLGNIYAQRLDGVDGAPQWDPEGIAICTATFQQSSPHSESDGSDGAIITWWGYRDVWEMDAYTQRVDASGTPQWTADGVAVCTAPGEQRPLIASDGSGGAIITWADFRSDAEGDIYAHHVTSDGLPDVASWKDDGNPVSIHPLGSSRRYPQITADGSGGAIMAWEFNGAGDWGDIYAQRMTAASCPLWTTDGVPICTAPYGQGSQQLASDGTGGAIITWQDNRNWMTGGDIYAQRVDALGNVQWTADGKAICALAQNQRYAHILSDGTGGAFITWMDWRSSGDGGPGIYVQRADSLGYMQWGANGVLVTTTPNWDDELAIASDDSSGAIITWADTRIGPFDTSIYAQRVGPSGDMIWATEGVPICTAVNSQSDPQIVSDGQGGAIIAWNDRRIDGVHRDIYAQRVDPSGNVMWGGDDVAICSATNNQSVGQLASDGAGGAIITWQDQRTEGSGLGDIYAQHVNEAGDAQWTADGKPICVAANVQLRPQIAADGSGGATIVWEDGRNWSGDPANRDIYAQHVDVSGSVMWAENGESICGAEYDQLAPRITPSDAGAAIMVWEDLRSNVQYDIYAMLLSGQVPSGACCDLDGFCALTTQALCTAPNVWQGSDTSCAPNPCPQLGACCALSGACTITMEADCASPSLWHAELTSCDPNNCPPADKTLCEIAATDPVTGIPLLQGAYVHCSGLALCSSGTWQTTNIEFQITDGQCCVTVFKSGATTPVVNQGDQVQVVGTVGQFNGKEEILNSIITIQSSGNPLPWPEVITTHELAENGENYEGCLIETRCVQIVGGNPWPAAGSNATIQIDDGSGPADLWIDRDTDIDGSPQPTGHFTVVGIDNQFDTTQPYTAGYQIEPRSLSDLSTCEGACCSSGGVCSIQMETVCEQASGTWAGIGTTCIPDQCVVLPPEGNPSYPDIQAAVSAMPNNSVLLLGAGTFSGLGNYEIDPGTKTMTIRGVPGGGTIIDCGGDSHLAFIFNGSGACVVEDVTLVNCESPILLRATGYGGAISCIDSSPTFDGVTILGGTAQVGGGGIYCSGGAPVITNCTIVGCSAPHGGAIYLANGAQLTMSNTIIASSTQGEAIWCVDTSSAILTCSDLYGNEGGDWVGGAAGQGELRNNLHLDPLFCDPGVGILTLRSDSPCAAHPVCGLVGSLGVGCMPASVLESETLPSAFRLYAAQPNPFTQETTIRYELSEAALVQLMIYDVSGRAVRTLVSETRPAGRFVATWDGRDDGSRPVSRGIYFYTMKAGTYQSQRRMTLLK